MTDQPTTPEDPDTTEVPAGESTPDVNDDGIATSDAPDAPAVPDADDYPGDDNDAQQGDTPPQTGGAL